MEADTNKFASVVVRLSRQYYWRELPIYQLTVIESPRPMRGGAFSINDEAQLEAFRLLVRDAFEFEASFYREVFETPEEAVAYQDTVLRNLHRLGLNFFKLLPQAFQEDLIAILQTLPLSSGGIRLVLEADVNDEATALLDLPWELALAHRNLAYFARTGKIFVVRCLLNTTPPAHVPSSIPPRILHMRTIGQDDPEPEEMHDLMEAEATAMQGVFLGSSYHAIDTFDNYSQMQALLQTVPFTMLHFTGHGNYPDVAYATDDLSFLLMIDQTGAFQPITGERLSVDIREAALGVVVLNACHSAATTPGNAALTLAASGVPFVVAMQGKLHLTAARAFSKAFYTTLAKPDISVEAALVAGRTAIAKAVPYGMDWCLPTLYMAGGLVPYPRAYQWALGLWNAAGPLSRFWVVPFHVAGGTALTGLSVLLALSGIPIKMPPATVLAGYMGAIGVLPFGIALYTYLVYFRTRVATVPGLPHVSVITTLVVSALIGFGMAWFQGWSLVLLVIASGLWQELTPLAQVLVLIPVVVWAVVLSFSQSVGHATALLDNARVEPPKADYVFVLVAIFAMALMVYGPLVVLHWLPVLATPPFSTVVVAGLWWLLAYALWQNQQRR
jgi:hypothetical protein